MTGIAKEPDMIPMIPDVIQEAEATVAAATAAEVAAVAKKWEAASREIVNYTDSLLDRLDVITFVHPGATGETLEVAYFDPRLAEIRMDPQGRDPERWRSDPTLTGVLHHEAGHATFSRWTFPEGVSDNIAQAALLLEEIRMEKRALDVHPDWKSQLEAAQAENLDFSKKSYERDARISPGVAAKITVLVVARHEILRFFQDDPHMPSIKKLSITGMEGDKNRHDAILNVCRKAVAVPDHDADAMIALGKALVNLWPGTPGIMFLAPHFTPRVALPPDEEDKAEEKRTSSDRKPGKREEGKEEQQSTSMSMSFPVDTESVLVEAADTTSKIVLRDSAVRLSRIAFRKPGNSDRILQRRIRRWLEEIYLVDRKVTRRKEPTPPGRLVMREVMKSAAERAAGLAVPAAEPFLRRSVRRDPVPPLHVAILQDISGSQSAAARAVSEGAWALAAACRALPDVRVAMLGFGEDVVRVFGPDEPIPGVPVVSCEDDGEVLSRALSAAEGMLDLMSPKAVRLVIVVTDGRFVTRGETEKRDGRLKRLTDADCEVLWVDSAPGRGSDPRHRPSRGTGVTIARFAGTNAPRQIGDAAVRALTRRQSRQASG